MASKPEPKPKPCVVCGRAFNRNRAEHRHCSGCCRLRAYRIRQRAGRSTPRAQLPHPEPPAAGEPFQPSAAAAPLEREPLGADERARLEQEVADLRRQLTEEGKRGAVQEVTWRSELDQEQRRHAQEVAELRRQLAEEYEQQEAIWRKELDDERQRHEKHEAAGAQARERIRAELAEVREEASRQAQEQARRRESLAQSLRKASADQLSEVRKELKATRDAEGESKAGLKKAQKQIAKLQKQVQQFDEASDAWQETMLSGREESAPDLETVRGERDSAPNLVTSLKAQVERLSGQLRTAHQELSQYRIRATSAAPVPKAGERLGDFVTRAVDKLLTGVSGLAGGVAFQLGRLVEAKAQVPQRKLQAYEPDCDFITITVSYPRSAERALVALPAPPRRRQLLNGR